MKPNFCPICDIYITPETTSAECHHWGLSELVMCANCGKQYIKGWAHECTFIPNPDLVVTEVDEEKGTITAEFKKYDNEKPQLAHLPWKALIEVAKVMDYGAAKYGRDNYLLCDDLSRYQSAELRHFTADKGGEMYDKESGLLHKAHKACNALMELEVFLANQK